MGLEGLPGGLQGAGLRASRAGHRTHCKACLIGGACGLAIGAGLTDKM